MWFQRLFVLLKQMVLQRAIDPMMIVGSPVLMGSSQETKENTISEDEDEPPATAAEALKDGQRLLRWLECCSDPSVTASQLLQFR